MRVILDVVQGPRKGRSFVFDRHDTFIVGRSRFVHCPMPEDSALSRDHFLDRGQPAPLRAARPGQHQRHVRQRRAGRAGPARARATGSRPGRASSWSGSRGRPAIDVGGDAAARPTPTAGGRWARRQPIVCAGCGGRAPPGIDIASGSDAGPRRLDPVALRPLPGRGRHLAPAGAALHHDPRARPGRDGGRLPRPAQPDRPDGRPEADRARDAPRPGRPSTGSSARCRSSASSSTRTSSSGWSRGRPAASSGSRWSTSPARTWRPWPTPSRAATRSTRPAGWPARCSKGLEHAHALGFVHRDIKPENILIGQTTAGLVAKISDFGLAKSFRGIGLSGLTFSGEMRGTIPFMPPEQMLDFKTVLPIRRPLRDRRDALLPHLRPVHLRPGRPRAAT